MKVHCDEGVAIHIGPEPCVGPREGVDEASAGEHVGQPLSRERNNIPDADAVHLVEGNMGEHDMRALPRSGVVAHPGMHGSSLYGNREISGLAIFSSEGVVRSGKARSRSR